MWNCGLDRIIIFPSGNDINFIVSFCMSYVSAVSNPTKKGMSRELWWFVICHALSFAFWVSISVGKLGYFWCLVGEPIPFRRLRLVSLACHAKPSNFWSSPWSHQENLCSCMVFSAPRTCRSCGWGLRESLHRCRNRITKLLLHFTLYDALSQFCELAVE